MGNAAGDDRRQAHRVTMDVAGMATKSDGSTVAVVFKNLSADGFCFSANDPFAVGEEIYLKLGRTNVRAIVHWTEGRSVGGALLDPIPTLS